MAEKHVDCVEDEFVETSDGTRSSVIEDTTTSTTTESSFFTAKEEWVAMNAMGYTATSQEPAEYFSTRIQSMIESRSEQVSIEASKDHWTELWSDDEEEWSAEQNLELYRSLQQQWPDGFFLNWNDDVVALGEKIAEGGQGEIIKLRYLHPEDAHLNDAAVLKVFKVGTSLRHLQKQWPQGMLLKASSNSSSIYSSDHSSAVLKGMMLTDGRFAFVMRTFWGDLRTLTDLRVAHNGRFRFWRSPPFVDVKALHIMLDIARGMRALHEDNIVHRDLKAANVLISVPPDPSSSGFDPVRDDCFYPFVADFECSLGVVGTGFWRAPEILLGLKEGDVHPDSFTEKSDVYSYAMTFYEILTGKMPLEDLRACDYDAVLHGTRPVLPRSTIPWVRVLINRCWHHEPSQRPSFEEIVEEFQSHGYRDLTLEEINGD